MTNNYGDTKVLRPSISNGHTITNKGLKSRWVLALLLGSKRFRSRKPDPNQMTHDPHHVMLTGLVTACCIPWDQLPAQLAAAAGFTPRHLALSRVDDHRGRSCAQQGEASMVELAGIHLRCHIPTMWSLTSYKLVYQQLRWGDFYQS